MKTAISKKKSRTKKPLNFYKYKIETEINALQKKYDELKQQMEEQHLENIQTDEFLLKYLRNSNSVKYQ